MNREEAEKIIVERLGAHFQGMVTSVLTDDVGYLHAIALDALEYGVAAAVGHPEAARNLEHLKAQVKLLSDLVEVREGKRINDTLLGIAMIAAEVLGQLLKGAV